MTLLIRLPFILFFLPAVLLAVTARSINDFRFDNLENFEFSNVTFVENGGIQLSRATRTVLTDPGVLWDLEASDSGFLLTAGENATLYRFSDGRRTPIFADSNFLIFSDIRISGKFTYLAAIPEGTVLKLDDSFRLRKTVRLTNRYVWEILPAPKGHYLLCGDPATLYYLNDQDEVEWGIDVPGETHLLKGEFCRNSLYVMGEGSTLYRLSEGRSPKITAVQTFDNTIADILASGNRIYIAVSSRETARSSTGSASGTEGESSSKSSGTEHRTVRPTGALSSVYVYTPDGTLEEVFRRNNVRFLSLTLSGGDLIIGTDKNAGYFDISPGESRPARFTSLGDGKFFKFLKVSGKSYAVLLDPSRIVEIGDGLAAQGFFRSGPFDTGGLSRWGRVRADYSLLPGTTVRIRSRSGAVLTEELWENWKDDRPGSDAVPDPNRFYQYEVELTSDKGRQSPVFRSLSVPFAQKNSAPVIDRVSILAAPNPGVWKISWESRDDDKDSLTYDLYLTRTEKDWIKLNDKPLEDTSYELAMDTYPDGLYRAKVTVSDERSNPASEARRTFRVSEPFPIDNTPPEISEIKITRTGDLTVIRWTAGDTASLLDEASYCVNGGKWIKILPADGLFDGKVKTFEAAVRERAPFLIQVQVSDAMGNTSVRGLPVPE